MRRVDLARRIGRIPAFPSPNLALEQVVTPAAIAAELLQEAFGRGDLTSGPVVDLGCGTGRLAIGAAIMGARPVIGIDADPIALRVAERAAASLKVHVEFRAGSLPGAPVPEGTVIMNPPFGAQRKRADRPFWDVALRAGRRAVYAFALAESRNFIAALAVEREAQIEATRSVPWTLSATFAHHRRRSVDLPVDLWVLRTGKDSG